VRKSILIVVALTVAATGLARLARSQTPDPLDPVRLLIPGQSPMHVPTARAAAIHG